LNAFTEAAVMTDNALQFISTVVPATFKIKMARTLGRLAKIQASGHRFFFGTIDAYDDKRAAWTLSDGVPMLNFCTYSYLGLLKHRYIQEQAQQALAHYGTGTHGVRLLGGNLSIHEQLERKIASFFGRDGAITFTSGFMTNLTVLDSMVGKGDYIFCDERNHASIMDGCRISGATTFKFRHNDLQELSAKLASTPAESRKLIVVDAVYSMDGDIAPLPELIKLRNQYPNTMLMVDEAHSFGVIGQSAKGIEEHFDCRGQIDILMGTLSKTIPSQGGFIAASAEIINYLRYSARGFIFSAAISPVSAAAALAAFEVIEQEGAVRRARLFANVSYFLARLREEGFNIGSTETAIIPVLLGNEATAFEMARYCHNQGVYVMPVGYPAVPKGAERLRMNVTCDHRQSDLDHALDVLLQARKHVE
jgi:8-amino-7-oxononanoate synthase